MLLYVYSVTLVCALIMNSVMLVLMIWRLGWLISAGSHHSRTKVRWRLQRPTWRRSWTAMKCWPVSELVLTLWCPLLPYGYSYKASCARPG